MTEEQKKLQEIYNTEFVPNYNSEKYAEANRLLIENPGLDNYLTNYQVQNMIKYVLEINNEMITEIKSDLETILTKSEKIDKIK